MRVSDTQVIPALPEENYHAHPALSQSGAKLLLPPSCPAIYRWHQDNPPGPDERFDIGQGAHSLLLGVGADLVEIPADDWRRKATQEQADTIRAAGAVPLLSRTYQLVHTMADTVRSHRLANALLTAGQPELSLFWSDPQTGAPLRGRLDYWRPDLGVIVDYKTTAGGVHPALWGKAMADYGYCIQAAAYIDGVRATGLHHDPAFLWVVQSKQPPHLVTVIEPDAEALAVGAQLWRQAVDIYAACTDSGQWPAYPDEISYASLPAWYVRQLETTS
jgi:PDDEXK-like domain of unknown function (DUF3799)